MYVKHFYLTCLNGLIAKTKTYRQIKENQNIEGRSITTNIEMVSSPPALSPGPSPGVRWQLATRSVKSSPFLLLLASPNRISGFSTFRLHSSRLRSTARGTPDPSTSLCTSMGLSHTPQILQFLENGQELDLLEGKKCEQGNNSQIDWTNSSRASRRRLPLVDRPADVAEFVFPLARPELPLIRNHNSGRSGEIFGGWKYGMD